MDFGNYNNILPKCHEHKDFELGFSVGMPPYHHFYYKIAKDGLAANVKLKVEEKNIREIEILVFDQKIFIQLNKNKMVEKIIINDINFSLGKAEFCWEKSRNTIIPFIYEKNDSKDYYMSPIYFYYDRHRGSSLKEEVVKVLSRLTSGRSKTENKLKFFDGISSLQSKEALLKKLQEVKSYTTISNYFKNVNISDSLFITLNNLIVFDKLNLLIAGINYRLNEIIANTYYLKPVRVNAERYYRVQGFTTNNVDSDGNNLPMIFYNMKDEVKAEFKQWCIEKFDLFFSVEMSEGHVSLIVEDLKGNKSNLVDTGYGYSQVLPIIVQLWLLKKNNTKKSREFVDQIILVIEQPELHLHPAFQAKLMDLFVGLIQEMKDEKIDFKIIFETHSETMINRLGFLVSENKFDKELANIVLVEKEDKVSRFIQTSFTEDGYIDHWPIGFMSPEA